MSPVELFSPVAVVAPTTAPVAASADDADAFAATLLLATAASGRTAEGSIAPATSEDGSEAVGPEAASLLAALFAGGAVQTAIVNAAPGASSGATPGAASSLATAVPMVAPGVAASLPGGPIEAPAPDATLGSGGRPPLAEAPAVAATGAGETAGAAAEPAASRGSNVLQDAAAPPPGLIRIAAKGLPAAERANGVPAAVVAAAQASTPQEPAAAPSPSVSTAAAPPAQPVPPPQRGAQNASGRAVERASANAAVSRAATAGDAGDAFASDAAQTSDGDAPAPVAASMTGPIPPPAAPSATTGGASPLAAAVVPGAAVTVGDEADVSDAAAVDEASGQALGQTPGGPLQGGATHAAPQPHGAQISLASAGTVAHLAAEIGRRLEGRSTRFDLELNPGDLGRVDVRLDVGKDGQITAQLSFDNPLAAAELRARADELRRSLEDAGFQLARDALTFAERDPRGDGREQGGSDRPTRGRAFSGAAALAEAADAPVRRAGLSRSALDVRV